MKLEVTNELGEKVFLEPSLELYKVSDFMGTPLPGLAVFLDAITAAGREPYCALTVSFGEFIGIKNSAYIDTNNCRVADQLLKQGIAEAAGMYKESGYCKYPLWIFTETFLNEIGGENYRQYSEEYDKYMTRMYGAVAEEEEEDFYKAAEAYPGETDEDRAARLAYKPVYLPECAADETRKGQAPVCFSEFKTNEWSDEDIRAYYQEQLKGLELGQQVQ